MKEENKASFIQTKKAILNCFVFPMSLKGPSLHFYLLQTPLIGTTQ